MSERADADLINDIREAIRRIAAYVGDVSYETFRQDTKTQDAVIRNIEIIGEAARGISQGLRALSRGIPWKSMVGMRDRLIHHYFGINLDIVWQVVSTELPRLAPELDALVEEGPEEERGDGR